MFDYLMTRISLNDVVKKAMDYSVTHKNDIDDSNSVKRHKGRNLK